MSYFGKLWAMLKGFFIRAGDDLVSGSPEAIKSTYATAIDEAKRKYKDMEGAVALLARERERTAQTLKELEREEDELQQKLEGALTAAEAEPQNPVHRERGTHFQMRIQEIDNKQLSLTQELDTQSRKVEEYKGRLRSFMDEIEKLKKEQSEMVAVYVSTQQMLSLEDRLKGIGETAVDESIIAIREKVENMRARAKIAAEMGSTKTEIHDKNYEELGRQKLAESRFDETTQS